MKVEPTEIKDLLVLTPKVFGDSRGYFIETWKEELFNELGFPHFVQDNHAFSSKAGVFRGMHFQRNPMAQSKFVWVSSGAALDIVIDIRKDSATYGKVFSIVLDDKSFHRLFVPQGFAHGYLTLEDNTHFHYKVDNYYSAKDEGGISSKSSLLTPHINKYFNAEVQMSEKDCELPLFENFESPF